MTTNPQEPNQRNEQLEKLRKLAAENNLLGNATSDEFASLLNSERPKIMVPADQRELIEFAKECGAELKKDDRLFRRDLSVVVVNKEKGRLDALTPRAMRSFAQRFVVFFKFKTTELDGDKRTVTIVKNIATETAGALLESRDLIEQLPEISRINPTRLPIIREDGRIELLRPGYFAEQRIYTLDDGVVLDEEMTLDQAKEVYGELLRYFPFPNERSKSVSIAAMLTMFCATMLPRNALRPGFIYTANSPGAGKTLNAKMAIIPVVGSCSTRTLPRKEEARKVLDVAAMDATPYILFDNIRGVIAGEEIEAFITSPKIEGRVLGESTKFSVDNVATVFLTGNGTTTSEDMQERCMFIELFVSEADNRERTKKIPFRIDDSWLASPQNRSRILSAHWALVRNWDAASRPEPPITLNFPRFEDWSRLIGGIVKCAGYEDPLAVPDVPNLGSIEGREMRSLVEALAPTKVDQRGETIIDTQAGGFIEWKFAEIIEKVTTLGLFEELEIRKGRNFEDMFQDGAITQAGKSHFGKMLLRYSGRTFAVQGAMMRFLVEGRGNTRKFKIVCEQSPQGDPF